MTPEQTAHLTSFLNGFILLGDFTAGLFFLRFWTQTRDRLFAFFCVAFWCLGGIRVAMQLIGTPGDEHYLYWFRLVAYLIILAAIIDKNWRK